ncbi:MAG: TIM barrel protein [Planctomycetales bacterium]|nr:TIM barrel protein [Planctomycetales bacterium]
MNNELQRRHFLQIAAAGGAAALASNAFGQERKRVGEEGASEAQKENKANAAPLPFKISLAEWSLHRTIRAGKLDNLDFAKTAKEQFKINAVEYVNQFFMDKAEDKKYLADLKQRHEDLGVKCLLIMIDREGALGDADDAKRTAAVEAHYKWVEAAKFLGCHSIRVNAQSTNDYEEAKKLAADGLRRLSTFAADHKINVIVENHGGLSSNGKWLVETIGSVGLDNCGTLPDFGNFHDYDRYQGVTETMKFAKSVSAKSHDFDEQGNETKTDYAKMMKIVTDAGYNGFVGIEYEGSKLEEAEGIMATKKLLMKVRRKMRNA